MKRLSVFLIILSFTFGCKTVKNDIDSSFEKISMIQLIANPEKYHLKKIKIEGYFVFEHEGNAIYFNKSDYQNMLFKNAVFLSINKNDLEKNLIEPPYKGYAGIIGVFNMKKLGTYNLYSGSLENVTVIDRLYKRGGKNDEYNMD